MFFHMSRCWKKNIAEGTFRRLKIKQLLQFAEVGSTNPRFKGKMNALFMARPIMLFLESLCAKCALENVALILKPTP
jgi:hypothetical protein